MKIPSFLPLTLVALTCFAFSAHAEEAKGKLDCQVPDLTPVRADLPPGLALDFELAQASPLSSSQSRDYDFPGSDVRVSVQLRFLGTRVEVSKTFFRRVNGSVQMMMVFVSPTSLDFPLMPGALYVLKSGEAGGPVPPFEIHCQLTVAK